MLIPKKLKTKLYTDYIDLNKSKSDVTIDRKSTSNVNLINNIPEQVKKDIKIPIVNDGDVGKIVFNTLKSNGSETNILEIVNDSNKSYLLLHPSGSFELYNGEGDHILKATKNNIIIGKKLVLHAEDIILRSNSNDLISDSDEIVTVNKLKAYLENITDSMGTLIFQINPIKLADIGTKTITIETNN